MEEKNMQDKETYVSGLIISQAGEDYKLRYKYRHFPNPIKLEDFKYILEGNKKAKINNQVETFFMTIDKEADLNECRKEMSTQLRNSFPIGNENTLENQEEMNFQPDLSVNSWDIFKERLDGCIDGRTEDYKFILTIIVSYWFIEYLVLLIY